MSLQDQIRKGSTETLIIVLIKQHDRECHPRKVSGIDRLRYAVIWPSGGNVAGDLSTEIGDPESSRGWQRVAQPD
jgi:hypothetical protein